MRDFISITQACGYWGEKRWNKTDSMHTFETGTILEFFSADSPDKVRGAGRDIPFIDECNNVPYGQLALRTRKINYLDYNAIVEFYVHTELLHRPDADYAQMTYKDN